MDDGPMGRALAKGNHGDRHDTAVLQDIADA